MDVFEIAIPGAGYPLPGGYDGLLEYLCITMRALLGHLLVPKLKLGNLVVEAPASCLAKLELRFAVPNLEIGNQQKVSSVNEIIFLIEDAPEGGFTAKALDAAIFTEADDINDLHLKLRDAVDCHFEPSSKPKIIRLHFVREEVIAA